MLTSMKSRVGRVASLLLGATVAFLGACDPPPYSGADSAAGAASIEMLFPEASETAEYCSTLIVVVGVGGVALAPDSVGADAVDGEGHWHLLDGGSHIGSTGDAWFTIDGSEALADGRHFFSAELVTNDHQSYSPKIESSLIEFEVLEGPDCLGGTTADDSDTGTAAARSRR
jgi:hypothetical protein